MTREELIHSAVAELQYQNEIDELYHHGILGQKWGVRRYQNEDGSVTPAGAKRYYVNGKDDSEGYTKAGEKYKKDLENRKDSKYNEKKYNERNKKLIIGLGVAAGLTIAAAVAVYNTPKIKEYINTQLDERIKVGDIMQNVSGRVDGSQNRDFAYVVNAKGTKGDDADKYKGFYAARQLVPKALGRNGWFAPASPEEIAENMTVNNIKAKQNAKIAGGNTIKKAMTDILKNMSDSEKESYISDLTKWADQRHDMDAVKKDIRSGKISNKTYDLINLAFMDDRNSGTVNARKKLVENLTKKGYVGIKDNNDRKSILEGGSGYHSKANILFKNNNVFDYSDLKKLSPQEAAKAVLSGNNIMNDPVGKKRSEIENHRNAASYIAQTGGILGSAAIGTAAMTKRNNQQRKRSTSGLSDSDKTAINRYKNSGMTNAEIARKLGVSESTVSKYLQ